MNSGLIFVLVLDFLIRLPFQKTPTQEVKPYLLLPIKRNRLIDFLLIRSGLDGFNLFWLFLFCSVFHHHRHQILWNQWCADLLHWHLAADGIQ